MDSHWKQAKIKDHKFVIHKDRIVLPTTEHSVLSSKRGTTAAQESIFSKLRGG